MRILSNTPPDRGSQALSRHFSETYFALRVALALLAGLMPLVLYFYGKVRHGIDLQPSMSAYFWAAGAEQCATFPMRTIFVGFLFAVGIALYAYKGLTPLENTLLNLAAICAAFVAIYPERISAEEAELDDRIAQLFTDCPAVAEWARTMVPSIPVHYIAAVTLFVLLAIVAWSCANKSLEYLPKNRNPESFRITYKVIALAMITFPALGIILAYFFQAGDAKVFFIEAAGIWTFATYWVVKSYELSLSHLERDPAEALSNAGPTQG